MAFAGVGEPVHDHSVEPLLGGNGQQLLRQGDVLLGSEAQSINDSAGFLFGRLDPFANFHFLLPGQQGDLAHLPQIHANRIIKEIEPLVLFRLHPRRSGLVHFGRVNDVDVQVSQFGQNAIQILRGHDVFRKRIVDVLVREVALVTGQPDQIFRLFDDVQARRGLGGSRTGSGGLRSGAPG